MTWVKKELGLHDERVRRHIRKALNLFVESEDKRRELEQENGDLSGSMDKDINP